jgi:hypothetical protein
MKRLINGVLLIGVLAQLGGCSLSSDEKEARVKSLKQAVDSFSAAAVQPNWDEAYKLSDGSFGNADNLKSNITKSWVQDATLTGGDVVSMAWIDDSTAKVKMTWSFQSGSVQSFSSETFIWGWKGNGWKYRGRVLR